MSKVDYLTEDSLLNQDQKFVCLSFFAPVSEDENKKNPAVAIKVRGVFESYDSACAHAKKLQSVDPYHNVFVGECGKWLPLNPDPDNEKEVKDSEYGNDKLNEMMKAYMENREKANLHHEYRKNEKIRQNLLDNMTVTQENIDDMKKKLETTNNKQTKETLENNIKNLENQLAKFNKKKKDVDEQVKDLESKLKMGGGPKRTGVNVLDVDNN